MEDICLVPYEKETSWTLNNNPPHLLCFYICLFLFSYMTSAIYALKIYILKKNVSGDHLLTVQDDLPQRVVQLPVLFSFSFFSTLMQLYKIFPSPEGQAIIRLGWYLYDTDLKVHFIFLFYPSQLFLLKFFLLVHFQPLNIPKKRNWTQINHFTSKFIHVKNKQITCQRMLENYPNL